MDRNEALVDLQDWLSEINWIVGFYTFEEKHELNWFERFLIVRNKVTVKTVRQRYSGKQEEKLSLFEQFCSEEMKMIDDLLIKLMIFSDKAKIVEVVVECYKVILGERYLSNESVVRFRDNA